MLSSPDICSAHARRTSRIQKWQTGDDPGCLMLGANCSPVCSRGICRAGGVTDHVRVATGRPLDLPGWKCGVEFVVVALSAAAAKASPRSFCGREMARGYSAPAVGKRVAREAEVFFQNPDDSRKIRDNRAKESEG